MKLTRNESKGVLFGVAAGLADYLKIDVGLIRAIFAVSFILGVGTTGIVYLVLSFILPDEDGETII